MPGKREQQEREDMREMQEAVNAVNAEALAADEPGEAAAVAVVETVPGDSDLKGKRFQPIPVTANILDHAVTQSGFTPSDIINAALIMMQEANPIVFRTALLTVITTKADLLLASFK